MWGNRSNQLEGKVTMVIASRKNEVEGRSVLKKIKVEGKVDEGREVIGRRATATLKWKGFESHMGWRICFGSESTPNFLQRKWFFYHLSDRGGIDEFDQGEIWERILNVV